MYKTSEVGKLPVTILVIDKCTNVLYNVHMAMKEKVTYI